MGPDTASATGNNQQRLPVPAPTSWEAGLTRRPSACSELYWASRTVRLLTWLLQRRDDELARLRVELFELQAGRGGPAWEGRPFGTLRVPWLRRQVDDPLVPAQLRGPLVRPGGYR